MANSIIRPLNPLTIQKIAAGEVIERPANVVKELVENALDAEATKISVTLEDGGKEGVRVADNGFGMTHEDARHCWLPHTTSKIRALEDLESVASFGFRGEALASMASVAELTLETRHWEEEMGLRLRIDESKLEDEEEIARSQGTTITLRHIFRYNPVRRKFLGSAKAEGGRIATLLTRLALAHPHASFRLSEGAREILHLPEGTLRRRVGDVVGAHVLEDLIEVDWESGGIHVQGYISEPQRFAGRAHQQHFFVNRRLVHSGLLARALAQAYGPSPPGRHPVAALFLSLPPAAVDVNVHPSKREIRFLQEGKVFWALSQALQRALRRVVDAPELDLSTPPAAIPPEAETAPAGGGATFAWTPPTASVRPADNREDTVPAEFPLPMPPVPPPESAGAPCLQIHRSFILVAVQSGYLLVNQQAAHRRILYEKALDDLRRPGRFSAQQLLFPELIELSAVETREVEEHLPALRALGFDLEPFGATAYQLRGLPGELAAEKAAPILRALIADLSAAPRGPTAAEALPDRLAQAYARAAAIPLGEVLDAARMAALIDGLFATRMPHSAPDGSPVWIRHTLEDIRRRFGLKSDPT